MYRALWLACFAMALGAAVPVHAAVIQASSLEEAERLIREPQADDCTIMFVAEAKRLLEDINHPMPQGLLTFALADWPSSADEDSVLDHLDRVTPILTDLLGMPAEGHLVTIRYQANLGNQGMYFPTLNEIRLSSRPTTTPGFSILLAHELSHAWRDECIIWASCLEEGIARAGETLVAKRLPLYYEDNYPRARHQDYDSVLERTGNQPELAATGGVFTLPALGRRYAFAGWAFWRLQEESGGTFLRAFHQDYFDRCRQDPSLPQYVEGVINLLGYHNPVVDGMPFAEWWGWYRVMDLSPPLGYAVYSYPEKIGVITFHRDGYNDLPSSGIVVDYTVRDRNGNVLASGQVVSNQYGNANPFLQFPNYEGRATASYSAHFPDSTIERTQAYWIMPSMPSSYEGFGLFGLADGDGPIQVSSLDGIINLTGSVENGEFTFPELDGMAGAFRIVWNGRTCVVRKDVAPYLILLNEQTMHQIGLADVTPAPVLKIGASAPNPFRASTTIPFVVAGDREVHLTIYDASGRAVRTLVAGQQSRGSHEVGWDGRNDRSQSVPSGVYFLRSSESATPVKLTRLP